MEGTLLSASRDIALIIEAMAVVIASLGAVEASAGVLSLPRTSNPGARQEIWRRFGTWLILALEFALAADIVRSVIAPTWTDIAQLAAIALIRTFLNYFLERDLERA